MSQASRASNARIKKALRQHKAILRRQRQAHRPDQPVAMADRDLNGRVSKDEFRKTAAMRFANAAAAIKCSRSGGRAAVPDRATVEALARQASALYDDLRFEEAEEKLQEAIQIVPGYKPALDLLDTIGEARERARREAEERLDRKSTRLNSSHRT